MHITTIGFSDFDKKNLEQAHRNKQKNYKVIYNTKSSYMKRHGLKIFDSLTEESIEIDLLFKLKS